MTSSARRPPRTFHPSAQTGSAASGSCRDNLHGLIVLPYRWEWSESGLSGQRWSKANHLIQTNAGTTSQDIGRIKIQDVIQERIVRVFLIFICDFLNSSKNTSILRTFAKRARRREEKDKTGHNYTFPQVHSRSCGYFRNYHR